MVFIKHYKYTSVRVKYISSVMFDIFHTGNIDILDTLSDIADFFLTFFIIFNQFL